MRYLITGRAGFIGSHLAEELLAQGHAVHVLDDLVPYDQPHEEGFEDMRRRVPDVERIHAAIGWTAQRSLDEILRDVIEFERSGQPDLAEVGVPA